MGRADHVDQSRRAASPIRISTYPGGNPFPALPTGWQTQPFPAFGVYVNAPLDTKSDRRCSNGTSARSGRSATGCCRRSYLGNHSSHLWRATELNPAVYSPGATTGTTNQRRVLFLQNPVQGQFYGTIGQLDDTGRAHYHGMLLSAQRRLKNNLSVLSNYTLSKCMSDPATTEITGPTIVDPTNPDLDYSYCDSDRRHVVNVSVVLRTPRVRRTRRMRVCSSDWQLAPLVRWQSGNRRRLRPASTTRFTGMGGQRAVQVLDDPYGDGTPDNYLNRDAFTSPDPGTYSTLKPNTIVEPVAVAERSGDHPHVQGG